MKTCYLDSNIILAFLDSNTQFHNQSKAILSRLVAEDWVINISALALDECFHNSIRFSKKIRLLAIRELKMRFKQLIKLPNVKFVTTSARLKRHIKVLSLMEKFNLKTRDAYHLFIMLENKIKYFATFDSDFDMVFRKGLVKQFRSYLKQPSS